MSDTVTIAKESQRRLNRSALVDQIDYISSRMLAAGRDSVWSVGRKITDPTEAVDGIYTYQCRFSFKRIGRAVHKDVAAEQVRNMQRIGQAAGNASGWMFPESTNGNSKPKSESREQDEIEEEAPLIALPHGGNPFDNWSGNFTHIFERDSQIGIIRSALEQFFMSEKENRFHCLLYGSAACGKTEIIRSVKKALGSEMVLEFDSTATTSAGAIKTLTEAAVPPSILICEELEKCDESSRRWLGGLLDHRAEIRKTTFRSSIHREIKLLCLATVNDMGLLERSDSGFLASRFSNRIYCPRPSKTALRAILEREVAKINGDKAWIEPAIEWVVEHEKTNDPRRVTTVCLCGREKLLDGSYQKMLGDVMEKRS